MSVDAEKLRALLAAATLGPNASGMLAEKREVMLGNAADWARAFAGECRKHCTHTAEQHFNARWHLACVYLDLIEERGRLLNALPQLLAIAEAAMVYVDAERTKNGYSTTQYHALLAAVDAARKAGT